ncbi:MAG TPA: class I SAM-dependent methyltransferase [Fimbriimonas sp.]|nr:class I SAM-dependent methyltransferase [Fimbriimonas sp.]
MLPTERFSNRVENYVKYRPSYPSEVLDFLVSRFSLEPGAMVADVGSGTGIFSRLLIDRGFRVVGVEPNSAMREASLGIEGPFTSVDATAEATGLEPGSVDLVVATQAFHWFDAQLFRKECERILRGSKPVALIWNARSDKDSEFSIAYEALIARYCSDYLATRHRSVSTEGMAEFFAPSQVETNVFSNHQTLDWDGFRGRLLSSSYAPVEGHPDHAPMIEALRAIYDKFSINGAVTLRYDCQVYSGELG